jgi:hypothetical protein
MQICTTSQLTTSSYRFHHASAVYKGRTSQKIRRQRPFGHICPSEQAHIQHAYLHAKNVQTSRTDEVVCELITSSLSYTRILTVYLRV